MTQEKKNRLWKEYQARRKTYKKKMIRENAKDDNIYEAYRSYQIRKALRK